MLKSVALLCFLNTAIADTGDTGSAGDTGITPEDTASGDTATAEPSAEDSGTTRDTGTIYSASFMAGEKGGFGCSTVGMSGAVAFWISTLLIGLRREE